MKELTVEQRVQNGVNFLNLINSGWYTKINLDSLNQQLTKYCVLGQLYGSFGIAKEKFKFDQEWYSYHGFTVSNLLDEEYHYIEYEKLTEEWKSQIKSLKGVHLSEPVKPGKYIIIKVPHGVDAEVGDEILVADSSSLGKYPDIFKFNHCINLRTNHIYYNYNVFVKEAE